jgi:CDP-paratose 2-epimerase
VRSAQPARVLVTGGAGFIGTNLTVHLLRAGAHVRILDSLARAGSRRNLDWLQHEFSERIEFVRADIRERAAVDAAVRGVDHIFHLAAQVAVTTSLVDPQTDFAVNAQGTINVLEAARACSPQPSLVFSSTNKVYGVLPDVELQATGTRYVPKDPQLRRRGIGESRPLDFHSPYGCSKGAADQYVLDYSRCYGLRSAVLRMSCIYGPHQDGNEDQGWVAHFARRALAREPVTIFGDGLQVRDLLFVEDLVAAFECARRHIDAVQGQAFNIGGGVTNTASLVEVLELIEQYTGESVHRDAGEWRVGDQRYYVSDIARFSELTGWRPRIDVHEGVNALCEWLAAQEFATHRQSPNALASGARA